MLDLEARPSKFSGLAYEPMAILMCTMWKARKPSQEPLKPLTILLWNWKPHLPNLMPWLMGTWLSWWLPYGIPGAPNKKQSSLCKSCFELGSQAFQILWLSSWAHGYPHGSHVVLLETKAKASSFCKSCFEIGSQVFHKLWLSFMGPWPSRWHPCWIPGCASMEAAKPLQLVFLVWKPGLPNPLAELMGPWLS